MFQVGSSEGLPVESVARNGELANCPAELSVSISFIYGIWFYFQMGSNKNGFCDVGVTTSK
jgi:hypothetical protein